MSDEVPPLNDGEVVERISKDDLKPLWGEHDHVFTADPTDETDDYRAEVCTVDSCGIGRLIRKH